MAMDEQSMMGVNRFSERRKEKKKLVSKSSR